MEQSPSKQRPAPAGAGRLRAGRPWLGALTIVGLTIVAYLPAFRAGYIWDDPDHVTQVSLQRTTSALKWVWFKPGATPQYYPLTHTTFWLEYRLWGTAPGGYHAVNIVLHAINALLLWLLLKRLGLRAAWLAAAIFAVHPVHVESVAWITERKNTLSGFFYLLALLAAVRAWRISDRSADTACEAGRKSRSNGGESGTLAELRSGVGPKRAGDTSPSKRQNQKAAASVSEAAGNGLERFSQSGSVRSIPDRLAGLLASRVSSDANVKIAYSACLVCFIAAVLSKTVACTLPAALALVLWWKHGALSRRDWLRLAPLFAIALAAAKLTSGMEQWNVGAVGPEFAFSLAERILIAGRALWFYAGKLLWPAPLAFMYPRWNLDPHSILQWLFPAAALAVVAALWLFRRRLGRRPIAAVLFFAGTLFPALGFVNVYPMRFSFVADHFQYLASIGLIALGASVLWEVLLSPMAPQSPAREPQNGIRIEVGNAAMYRRAVVCAALLLTLGFLTFRQSRVYHDAATLWLDTLAKNPDCWLAMDNLGADAEEHGRADEALQWYDRSLAAHPSQMEAHLNRGRLYERQKKWDAAAAEFTAATAIRPDRVEGLAAMAKLLAAQGRAAEAAADYEKTLDAEPRLEMARLEYAGLLRSLSQSALAEAQYRKAIAINPDSVAARSSLASMKIRQGALAEALQLFAEATDINPLDAALCNNYGYVLMQTGQSVEAQAQYAQAIADDPAFAEAYDGLGAALEAQGRTREAAEMYRQAIALKPGLAAAREHLAHLRGE